MRLYFETPIGLSVEKIKEKFNRDLFIFLAPNFIPFVLTRFDGCLKDHEIHIRLGPEVLSQEWISLITFEETNASGWSFIDEGKVLPWPLKSWKHHHRVDRIGPHESKVIDDIQYECSLSCLNILIKPLLWLVFAIRPGRYQKIFKD